MQKTKWIIWILGITSAALVALQCCKQPGNGHIVKEASPASYVGSNTCKNCHQQEHNLWLQSHHYAAMMPATDSTVAANFNNAKLTADGVTSTFFKRDGKFWINTEGADGQYRDYEILYTFGKEPLQQYLVAMEGGRMQATRATWNTVDKKWYHQYAGQKIAAEDWPHWRGDVQNWNTMCASCHSTNLVKGYEPTTDTYQTTYHEINVSCESCHGPGSKHVDYVRSASFDADNKVPGMYLLLHKGASQIQQINACAYCHTRRIDIAGNPHPGAELLNDLIPALPTTPNFYADGQMNDEVYNYTSFLQSKMYRRGVQCSHCHNAHSGKLKLDNSLVCGQCHSMEQFGSEAHTLHKASLTQVNCISCHMPVKNYMGHDERHDHSFRVPRPDLTVKYGTPNTCNSCHSNKTAAWAANVINMAFGPSRKYHFAEDLIPGSALNNQSEKHLNKLLADSAIPGIVRAAAMEYLSQIPSPAAHTQAIHYLTDSSHLLQYTALRALNRRALTGTDINAISLLLNNPVRAIRLAAAEVLTGINPSQLPEPFFSALQNATNELEKYFHFQTDFAQGNLQLADYYLRKQQYTEAIKYYRRSLAKDSLLVAARINLASVLSATGQNKKALKELLTSLKQQPQNDHIHYSLGLLYAELKDNNQAASYLQKAFAINKQNTRAIYNYGILMQGQQKWKEAEGAFKSGLAVNAQDTDVLYALSVLYLQQNKQPQARQTALQLKQLAPNNTNYAALYRQLGL